jgi:hypothetical protein
MRPDLYQPLHATQPLAELTATLEAHGLLDLLDAQLAKPMLGHPKFAVGRRLCRMRWLESELAVLRWEFEAAA